MIERIAIKYHNHKGNQFDEQQGFLLSFGIDYEDTKNGVGIYSTAIIETQSGNVINLPVEKITIIIKAPTK